MIQNHYTFRYPGSKTTFVKNLVFWPTLSKISTIGQLVQLATEAKQIG